MAILTETGEDGGGALGGVGGTGVGAADAELALCCEGFY